MVNPELGADSVRIIHSASLHFPQGLMTAVPLSNKGAVLDNQESYEDRSGIQGSTSISFMAALKPSSVGDEQPQEEASSAQNREPVKILVIGSRNGVMTIIQTLYRLGFATVGEWSPLLPGPNSGEVMSILTRYLLTK